MMDKSYFTMVDEHQKLSERVLRLHTLLDQHSCIQHLPTEACTIINEMSNIVNTGTAQPQSLESLYLDFDSNQLPFIDSEQSRHHDFKVGEIVRIPSKLGQYKFVVSGKQRFRIMELLGTDRLQLKCECGSIEAWGSFNTEITGHFSHFIRVANKSCLT